MQGGGSGNGPPNGGNRPFPPGGGEPPGGGSPPDGGYGAPPPPGGYGAPPPGGYGAPPPPRGYGAPPPGGYGLAPIQPGGLIPYAGPRLNPHAAQVLTPRTSLNVVLFTLLTCGIYGMIWMYQTTDELRVATGDESLKPGLDLALALLTCGVWWIYVDYRNAQKVYEVFRAMGVPRNDQSTAILLLAIFFRPVAFFLLQEEYTALGRLARGEPV